MDFEYRSSLIRKINIDEIDFHNAPFAKETMRLVLNGYDELHCKYIEMCRLAQSYKNEVHMLKGEKGIPDIKPGKKSTTQEAVKNDTDTIEPQAKKNWSKSSKKGKIKIDRVEIIKIDKSKLPQDAEFKGYEEVTVQEVVIKTDNVLYRREKYYSPSEHNVYIAELPEEVIGTEFGPNLKALCATLYFDYRVTENKMVKFLNEFGISISEGTLSNILIKENADVLTKEKSEIYMAGLKSTKYQQTDDTGFRVDGVNCYAQIMCNPYYSAYFVNKNKNRETVQSVVSNGTGKVAFFDILISDDAPQFDKVTDIRGLCWVHEYRHYKKLIPFINHNKELLAEFKSKISLFYKELKKYKESPSEAYKNELYDKFDRLFSIRTGYDMLDERIELTRSKRSQLLAVLEYPEIPLHNNLSENGLREIVVKRKVSCGTKTNDGTAAWENYLTISATCKKLGVSFFDYIKDIFSGKTQNPRLADLIRQKSICL